LRLDVSFFHHSCLITRFFIRIAVLLQTINAIFRFGAPEPSQERSGLNTADVHDSRIEFL
jgi:hypothetical protein